VSLICIGEFPGRPAFKGLGELSPEELAPLFQTRHRVTAAEYEVASRAWDAFTSPTPEALAALLRTDISALPFLAAALERFLQEYPWTTDGLSRSERRLLQLLVPGPAQIRDIFPRMHDGERAHWVTDTGLVDLIGTLSVTVPPLVSSDDRGVSLTDAGREVLAGTRDRVNCGLDRWFGGVHLRGVARWRWDDQSHRIVDA
jgi:hypothetical protein